MLFMKSTFLRNMCKANKIALYPSIWYVYCGVVLSVHLYHGRGGQLCRVIQLKVAPLYYLIVML